MLLREGGRVKSASIPYGEYSPNLFSSEFQEKIKEIVGGKDEKINSNFFPKIGSSLRTSLGRQPLRSIISTHQGIPGNFFPFTFSDKVNELLKYNYKGEHYEAVLEPRFHGIVSKEQENDFIEAMYLGDLGSAFKIIKGIDNIEKSSTKGRSPFFICRPSCTENDIELPLEKIPDIEKEVNIILENILYSAAYLENYFKNEGVISKKELLSFFLYENQLSYEIPSYFESSLSYFQADTFLNLNNQISIETLQFPDVGFFLKNLSDRGSLKNIKDINGKLRDKVIDNIHNFGFNDICLITREEVINSNEDLLEINEIQVMKDNLSINSKVTVSSIDNIDFQINKLYMLLNIDYSIITPSIINLFKLSVKYPNNFSPNPFIQYVSKYVTGFKKVFLTGDSDIQKLMNTTNPKHTKVNIDSYKNIENYFNGLGLNDNKRILNLKKSSSDEVLYVSRDSLHSLRKIANFVKDEKYIEIIEVPFVDGEQILSKNGNDLLHMFRFMFIK